MKEFVEPEVEVLNFDLEKYADLEEGPNGSNNMGWA